MFFAFIETDPLNPKYYQNRIIASMKILDYDSGIKDATEALKLDPKFAKAYNLICKCYLIKGELHKSSMAIS